MSEYPPLNIHSFSPQIRKLPSFLSFLLRSKAKLSSSALLICLSLLLLPCCTHYLAPPHLPPSLGSAAQLRSPFFLTPNSTSPFRARRLHFWVAVFPLLKSGHPPTLVPRATAGLFTSLFPSFYPLPSRLPSPPLPPSALCLLFVTVIANFEAGRLGRKGEVKCGEVRRRR